MVPKSAPNLQFHRRVRYDWSWDSATSTLSCSDGPGTCDLAVCACDKAAAECFSRSEYHEENKRANGYDKWGWQEC